MARSQPGWPAARIARVMAATTVAGAFAVLPLLAPVAAEARQPAKQPAGPLALTVTSVSPGYAAPGRTITIIGTIRNLTGQPINGLAVRLLSSRTAFSSVSALQQYAFGGYTPSLSPVARPSQQVPQLAGRALTGWRISLPAGALGLCAFGVYPLTVQVSDATGIDSAAVPVPLPFWPGRARGCGQSHRPRPDPISWIWPLMDNPHQGPCPGLLDNSLATSVAPGGRLYRLLEIGRRYAAYDHLTWAIDPALLDNVHTMTSAYVVGSAAGCGDTSQYPADQAAASWLRTLVRATTGQTVFVTPYADVDIAALTSAGSPDLGLAFKAGDQVAHAVLGRGAVPMPVPARPGQLSAIAWPADGIAGPAVLENLDALGVNTVIIATRQAALLPSAPSGVTTVVDGLGKKLHVLRPDQAIGQLLASPVATSRAPGAVFSVSQAFLAETAMIVAEQPRKRHPIVVTPPRRWDPAGALAGDLLAATRAPWLVPADAGQLVSGSSGRPRAMPPLILSARGELSGNLLGKVAGLDRRAALLESIITAGPPEGPPLHLAVFGIESSAWRGREIACGTAKPARPGAARCGPAWSTLARTSKFVFRQFAGLQVKGNPKVLLGGRVGSMPVSIHNALDYPVRVKLKIVASNHTVTVTDPAGVHVVPPHKIASFRLRVQATQGGSAWITLELTSPAGVALPSGRQVTKIEATSFGTLALYICAAALAIFVLASAARSIRHGRPGADAENPAAPTDNAPQPDNAPPGVSAVLPGAPEGADNVGHDRQELASSRRTPQEGR